MITLLWIVGAIIYLFVGGIFALGLLGKHGSPKDDKPIAGFITLIWPGIALVAILAIPAILLEWFVKWGKAHE